MSYVGRSMARSDARPKVTGSALYIDDYGYEGMLYAATVRSPRPRIRIKGIGWARAKKVPGFVAALTARDVPGKNLWPLVIHDYPFLADGEARFAGEAIALVVAETPEAAREAAAAVELSFEELPYVTDPLKALEKGAPKIYGEDNIFSRYTVRKGDVRKGFQEADVVVEGTFTTGYHVQSYLETQGMIAFPEAHGGVTVYGSMQCPYYVHDAVAAALGLPYNKVRIVQRTTGGGFGGKEDVPGLVGSHAAMAAKATGRPVKLIYSRAEDFLSMTKRHPSWSHVKYGAKKDGTLVACQVRYVLDGGAYATLSPIVLWRGAVHAAGPYRVPNVLIESFAAATNKVPCGAYRGFGQPQICFANESLIDELALKLGMDPLDLRMKNALKTGDRTATGQLLVESCAMEDALVAVRQESDWDRKRRLAKVEGTKRIGINVSANYYGVSLGARGRILDRAAAQVQVQPDGTVWIAIGNTEIGQGARTVMAQICADSLNAPYEAIQVMDTDTSRVPDSGPTVASRTTLMSGNAVLDACRPIRGRIFGVAQEMLKTQDFEADEGFFKGGGRNLSFQEVVRECHKRKLKMAEQGWYDSPPTSFDMETGQGDPYVTYSWSANVAEVEVDEETGETKVRKVVSAHDLGRAINPGTAEGQVEGAILQAVGYALIEEQVSVDGIIKNPNFTDYILPSSPDVPEYRTVLLEHPYKAGPYGAKGMAESPIIGVAPAITNAIHDACGIRLRHIPALPERIWESLEKKRGGGT